MTQDKHPAQFAGTQWNPQQYGKFADNRLRPAIELLTRVAVESPDCIYDLGCGAGKITEIIRHRWPDTEVFGLDSSRQILQQAESSASTDINWVEVDIEN